MNIQGWYPLGLTGLISLLSKGLSRVFFSTSIVTPYSVSFLILSGPLAFRQPWICVSADLPLHGWSSQTGQPPLAHLLHQNLHSPHVSFLAYSFPLHLVARSLTSHRDNGKIYDQASKKHLCHLQKVECWSDTCDKCLCCYQRKMERERRDNRWYKRGKNDINDTKGEVKGTNTRRMGCRALICWMGFVTWEEFGWFTCDTVWLGLQCKTLT